MDNVKSKKSSSKCVLLKVRNILWWSFFLTNAALIILGIKSKTNRKKWNLKKCWRKRKLIRANWLTDERLRYPFFHVGIEGWVGCLGKKTDWGMGKMCALCSGPPKRAVVLTLAPSPSPACTLVVVTPASTCPSRCQKEHVTFSV